MHFPLLRVIILRLQLGSADSNTAIVLLIPELALHRADGAESWRCLQQLCLFRMLSRRPGGAGVPPLVLLGLRGLGCSSLGQRKPQCQPVAMMAIWSQNLLHWSCKGMQQRTWFFWKKMTDILEIQLLTESKNWYLKSGMKCTMHGVANFSLKQQEYHVSATPEETMRRRGVKEIKKELSC